MRRLSSEGENSPDSHVAIIRAFPSPPKANAASCRMVKLAAARAALIRVPIVSGIESRYIYQHARVNT